MSGANLPLTCLLVLSLAACVSNINPDWRCIRADEPIPLYESSQLATQIGTLEAKERAEIIDTIRLKPPAPAAGAVTHFRVRTHDGVEGWFLWEGNKFAGYSRGNAGKSSRCEVVPDAQSR